MTYTLAFDGGKSSGIVLGEYGDDQTWTRLAMWQVSGGIAGFLDWYYANTYEYIEGPVTFTYSEPVETVYMSSPEAEKNWPTIISERFIPLSGGGFAQTSDSVEPLRIEGALIALGLMPADYTDKRWQRPAAMYFSGGSNKAERLKASRAFLKSHGLLPTGKDVGQKDADDAISATLHSLAYMRKISHAPTIGHYWPEED